MKYRIPYGSRPADVITLELSDITDAVEIVDAAYAALENWKLAGNVLASANAGRFEVE